MNKLVTKIFCSLMASLLLVCLLFSYESFAVNEINRIEVTPSYRIVTSCVNGDISGHRTVVKGKSTTISYQAHRGYYVKSITVDGKSVSPTKYPKSYKFTSVNKKHTIKVNCALMKYNLMVYVYTLPANETDLTKAKLYNKYSKTLAYSAGDMLVRLPATSYRCFAVVSGNHRLSGYVSHLPMRYGAEDFGFKPINVTSTPNVLKIYYQQAPPSVVDDAPVVEEPVNNEPVSNESTDVVSSYDVTFKCNDGAVINTNKLSVVEGCIIDKLPNAELDFGYVGNGWFADKDVTLQDGTQIKAGELISPVIARNIKVTEALNLTYVVDKIDDSLAYAAVSSSIENGVINYCGNVNLVSGLDYTFEYVPYDGYKVESIQVGNSTYQIKAWKAYENSYKIRNLTGATSIKVKCVKVD